VIIESRFQSFFCRVPLGPLEKIFHLQEVISIIFIEIYHSLKIFQIISIRVQRRRLLWHLRTTPASSDCRTDPRAVKPRDRVKSRAAQPSEVGHLPSLPPSANQGRSNDRNARSASPRPTHGPRSRSERTRTSWRVPTPASARLARTR
jgi:hypothetical protein